MGKLRNFSFRSRATMSTPPVEAPARNTIPRPAPMVTPPKMAAMIGSVCGTGRSKNRSKHTDVTTMPKSEPKKNSLPILR